MRGRIKTKERKLRFEHILYFLIVSLFSVNLCSVKSNDNLIKIEHFQKSHRFLKFNRFIGAKLQSFQKRFMPKAESVFYPFGGPDLLYPLLLFPDAKTYVLVGLEPPGEALSQKNEETSFEKLNSLLRRGFFVTSSMGQTFNEKSGVRALLTIQILLLGGKIIDEQLIDANTVSISFEWEGKKKTIYYLKRNFPRDTESVFAFLKTHNIDDTCLIKAGSYLLHQKMFFNLKENILNKFSLLVQDDTGVPLKELQDHDILLFGHYVKPYGAEFRQFQQNDLKKRFADTQDIPPLNFCFGYGCGRVQANLMVAKPKRTSFMFKPEPCKPGDILTLGNPSASTIWVYLGGLTKNINADQELANRQSLDRLGKELNIRFLAIHPFDRCEKADNKLCWRHETDEETLDTYEKILSALNNEKIHGFVGFSNGGWFLNHLAQIKELHCPIISIGSAGTFSPKGSVSNILTLLIGKLETSYDDTQKFFKQAKGSPLSVTFVEHEGGHILPFYEIEKLLKEIGDH